VEALRTYLLLRHYIFAPASKLQPFNYVMLVWATILGFFIFDDLPDYLTVLGATVIVISGLYAWNRERLN
jgi:drug/metabolite transporter (DMT)-like permease